MDPAGSSFVANDLPIVHIGALYPPGLSDVLVLKPVSLDLWIELLGIALVIFFTMEAHKWLGRSSRAAHAPA